MMNSNPTTTRTIALLMSCLLFVSSLMSFALGERQASAASGPYVPLPEPPSGYTGPLTWMDYTLSNPLGGSLGEQYRPYYLDTDENGNIYMTTISATLGAPGKVQLVSNNGQSVTDVTYGGNFTYPTGIAVDKDGNVYVADNSQMNANVEPNVVRIMKLPYGEGEWDDITNGQTINYGLGVAADRQGNVYVIDNKNVNPAMPNAARILKLASGDNDWDDITGTSPAISYPVDIAVDGEGNVFVSQAPYGGTPTQVFKLSVGDTAWTNVTPANATSGFYGYGVATDKYDNVYMISYTNSQVMKLGYAGDSDDWTVIELMPNPLSSTSNMDIAVDSEGNLYSTNNFRGNVNKLMASVIYNGNNPSGGTVPEDYSGYEAGKTAYVYDNTGNLTKTGHVFGGWNTAADAEGATYLPGDPIEMTQSVTLYAVWSLIPTYTVNYQATAGGTIGGPSAETVNEGDSPVSVPTVTPNADYTFLGWSSDGGTTFMTSDELAATAIAGNMTYVAYFRAPATLTDIHLDSESYRLRIRETHQTVVAAVYSDNSELTISSGISFSSSNSNVAAVDGTGLVIAKSGGTAVITAEYGGFQARATVSVPSDATSGSTITEQKAEAPGIEIILDGIKQEKMATATEETVNGQAVTTIVLDTNKVIDKLKSDRSKLLTIPLTGERSNVVGQLTGSLVKALELNNAVVQIVTDKAMYALPIEQIHIDSIAELLGSDVKLEDIIVSLQIFEASDKTTKQAEEAARRHGAELIVRPMNFTIMATYGSQSVEANRFKSYVERTITLPEGTDPSKITTGVVLTEDGDLSHVPTVVQERQGRAYAHLYSLTNSTYSVIYNPRAMSDVTNHWAKKEVHDMTSRLIVSGVTETEFHPNAPVSRAEFAAIVTHALGIQDAPYSGGFSDVGAADRFAGAVQAAIDYKLIDGFGKAMFLPDRLISREEAAVILAKAMEVAKLKTDLSAAEVTRLLSSFADGGETASWARKSVAAAISLNIISGRGEKLDLAANVTRAETAALVRRLLQAAEWINR